MKKVLFAAVAMAAVGSMAAAEVRLSASGRFGLDYNDGNGRTAADVGPGGTVGRSKITITSRLRLQVDMSAETDGGVAFGARFRAQAESRDNVARGATFNGARFFVSYEGLSVYVGNITGAVENTPGLYLETPTAGTGIDGAGFYSNVANVSNEFFNWNSYSSDDTGVNGVEAIYSAGGFIGHISYSERNGATATSRAAIMAAYTFGDWTAAASYQSSDVGAFEDKLVLTVAGNIGNFGVRAAYADNDGVGKWGLYGNVDIGAASNILLWVTSEDEVSAADAAAGRGRNQAASATCVAAFVGDCNGNAGESYGIHYSYDLGGGVSFETGYRRASNDNDTFQAGVHFSF